jgi:hypothetical protein
MAGDLADGVLATVNAPNRSSDCHEQKYTKMDRAHFREFSLYELAKDAEEQWDRVQLLVC